jgi:hypothetical protein
MRRIIGCFAISGFVGGCFASAAVLAQVGGAAPAPAPGPAADQAKKSSKKASGKGPAVLPKDANSPFDTSVSTVEVFTIRKAIVAPQVDVLKKAVDQKAVGRKNVVRGVQANRGPLIAQFTQQARPLLRAELIFARNVCHLNREELRKVNQEAQTMLAEVVEKLVDAQFQPRARMVQVQVQTQGRVPNSLDAQQLLQDGVVAVMKKNLSAKQWSLYEPERRKRDENRKHTTIRYFVDAIDRDLFLTPEQCKRLEDLLKEKWDAAWTMYLENHLFGNKYYPMTIEPVVTPILTDAQKQVWQGVQKVGIFWGFGGNILAGFANDGDGLEVELGEPLRQQQEANGMIPGMNMMRVNGPIGEPAGAPPKAAVRLKGEAVKGKGAVRVLEKKVGKTSE